MKIFQERTRIQKFENTKDFVEEYGLGESDFILASKAIYDKYFAPMGLKSHVVYKKDYGAGEPTDFMIDGLMRDFAQTDCTRIVAIGGGAVIDMAKLLVLGGSYRAEDIYQKKVQVKSMKQDN